MPPSLGRVLIVEDEPDVAAVLEYALLRAGATEVLVATDGLFAIELAGRELPDLILCDLMLPGLDGLEVATRLRAPGSNVHAPIVFVTAAAHTAFRAKPPSDYGAIGVLAKPFDVHRLGEQILELLARAP